MKNAMQTWLTVGLIAGAAVAQKPETADPAPPPAAERQAELAELRAENEKLRAWRRDLDQLRRLARTRFGVGVSVEPKPGRARRATRVRMRLPALSVAPSAQPDDPPYARALRELDAVRASLGEAGDDAEAARRALDDLDAAATEVRAALWGSADRAEAKSAAELRAENERLRAQIREGGTVARVLRDGPPLFGPVRPGPGVQLEAGTLGTVGEPRLRLEITVLPARPAVAEVERTGDPAHDRALRKLDAARSSLAEAADDRKAAHEALDDLFRAVMETRAALRKRRQ